MGLKSLDDFGGCGLPLIAPLQINLNSTAIRGGVCAIYSDERRQADYVGVLQNDRGKCLLAFGHGRKRDGLRRLRNSQNYSRVLHGEKSLGNVIVKKKRQKQSANRDDQSDRLVAQNDL